MSNPRVRAHLHFLPEDAGQKLSETWQAARWLTELDPDLATPMLRQGHNDFYTLEPTLLNGGQVCMPFRWFTRGSAVFARAWAMVQVPNSCGWLVLKYHEFDVCAEDLLLPYPNLKATFSSHQIYDPSHIVGTYIFGASINKSH